MKPQKIAIKNNKLYNHKRNSHQKNLKKKLTNFNYYDFLHTGNYVDYYLRRNNDDRPEYFQSQYFENSSVCDYGCHNGNFSFALFEKFHDIIKRYDGIDVQNECILNAQKALVQKVKDPTHNKIDYTKLFFQLGNWVDDNDICESVSTGEYNVILVLSVLKWIHLYHGDKGVKRFLQRVYNRLLPNGYLFIEPQERQSYIKTVKEFSGFIEENYKGLHIDPENLKPHLEEIGFHFVNIVKSKKHGQSFNREILLFQKTTKIENPH